MQENGFGCVPIYNKEFVRRGIDDVILWDVFHVDDGEVIRVVFESVNSEYRQGIWLHTDNGIEIDGHVLVSVDLWYDTAPKEVFCKCHTTHGRLSVYNIFMHTGHRMSQAASSGMRITDNENGRIYYCNDVGFDTNFNKLVFRFERIGTNQ